MITETRAQNKMMDGELLKPREDEEVLEQVVVNPYMRYAKSMTTVYWGDYDKTLVCIVYLDETDEHHHAEMVSVDRESDYWRSFLKFVGGEHIIDEATQAHNKAQIEWMQQFDAWAEGKSGQPLEAKVEKHIMPLTMELLKSHEFREDLFKLKLEIFEDENVAEKAPREVKSVLRKASSPLELIGRYFMFLETLDRPEESRRNPIHATPDNG